MRRRPDHKACSPAQLQLEPGPKRPRHAEGLVGTYLLASLTYRAQPSGHRIPVADPRALAVTSAQPSGQEQLF